MKNPFTVSFGKVPNKLITRIVQSNEIIDDFEDMSNQVYMITGVRGSGKTVMMTTVANSFKKDSTWIVLELNPERDILQAFAANLYSHPFIGRDIIDMKLDFSALGFGDSVEGKEKITDIENAISHMLKRVSKLKKKVLITIDEVTNTESIRVFCSAFQIFMRQEYPVFLLMTGLYENIYDIQNVKSLTFLYRAPKVVMTPLNLNSIANVYKTIFELSPKDANEMSVLTMGYPFAFQVLGYLRWQVGKNVPLEDILDEYDRYLEEYVYEKIWIDISPTDKKVLREMAASGETKVKLLREGLSMKSEEFAVYRDRLKRKGIINTENYGEVSFMLPRFDVFINKRLI